ncbi:MAG: hypothetical protein IRZ16_19785 [Myxococcaceae bacterium]|nr:hypothetical protein [Myxococcaceae bacterium]
MKTSFFAASVVVFAAAFASCAHQSAQAPEPSESAASRVDAASDGEVVGPPQVAWKDMTPEQRGRFMKAKVMPKMKPIFQAFDAKEFADFTCASCHGKNARDRQFHMPNPEIFALPASEEAFKPVMEQKPEWVKFMAEQVTPAMAELLGREPFNPQAPKPDAFSCGACHTTEGGEHGAEHAEAEQG